MFEEVRTNPGYGMATLIYNNLLNLILGTVPNAFKEVVNNNYYYYTIQDI